MSDTSPDMIAEMLMRTAKEHGAEIVALSFETEQAPRASGLHSYRALRQNTMKGIAETVVLLPDGT